MTMAISDARVSIFSELVAAELSRARRKFGPIHSLHEAKAVIEEELEEFWEIVRIWKGDTSKSPREIALKELVQIAAMAQRTAEDLGFIEEERNADLNRTVQECEEMDQQIHRATGRNKR